MATDSEPVSPAVEDAAAARAAAARASDPRIEERLGSVLHEKWTLERLLGVGGMGAVYAARHRNGARAAVKILSPAAGRAPHIRKRFLHEGYAANRVEHPGAVKVLDDDVIADGPDEGTAYLVMELLEGESLQERAKRDPPLGERDLLELADAVLSVLEAAHAHGVVHRDLKPDNLFLVAPPDPSLPPESQPGPTSRVKVLDFGLARLLETQEKTLAGMAVGTPTYMSPEQAAGQVENIDGRTDVYALGSILFQLLSRQRIHDAAHTLGLVIRMATTPAPKLKTVAPDVSDAFATIVDRALQFRREDRYPTAAEMHADVRSALAGVSLGKVPAAVSSAHVIASAATVAAGPTALAAAASGSDEDDARASETGERSTGGSTPPKKGSLTRYVALLGIVAVAAFAAWQQREAATRAALASIFPSATVASSELPLPSPPASDSAAVGLSATPSASSSAALDGGDFGDAAVDDDAAADEDEEEDEDDVDGAAAVTPSGSTSARQPSRPPGVRTAHPTHPSQRPPHPPGAKKKPSKKWHW